MENRKKKIYVVLIFNELLAISPASIVAKTFDLKSFGSGSCLHCAAMDMHW